jgi:transcriptional regulator with XRE-family HTH domain
MEVFNRVREQRLVHRIATQKDLAEKIGVHHKMVSAWERQEHQPSLAHLLALKRVLGCTLDDLVSTEPQCSCAWGRHRHGHHPDPTSPAL